MIRGALESQLDVPAGPRHPRQVPQARPEPGRNDSSISLFVRIYLKIRELLKHTGDLNKITRRFMFLPDIKELAVTWWSIDRGGGRSDVLRLWTSETVRSVLGGTSDEASVERGTAGRWGKGDTSTPWTRPGRPIDQGRTAASRAR